MCGRYASTWARQELIEQFQVRLDAAGDAVRPDYNIAPTKQVPAVLARPTEESAEEAVRQLRALRWGLVPSWAKDVKIGNRLINARAETVHEKPSFRRAFAKRRCLLPADGFYEWYTPQAAEGRRPVKQPFFIRPRDGAVMAMAGLYELWRSPDDPDGEWLWTCTVITTQAADDVGRIHDRMPMVVRPEHWDAWLDPGLTAVEEVRALLTPAMNGTMEAYPVSRAVNNVRNNGPDLIRPVTDGHMSGDRPETGTLF
ncbi:SOS response-associated peptidase [Thermomonospora catenispora]|uniref:SOS response-associated peptidase n=1 Tax=Thermomonospora catenispora TaxID=2493090 RepID=UPI0011239D0F|nr:SOS response-associated peptidase [Thermomonospora catenispora]TNY38454.1 SOS response-associated peptidase [Thermomonospora catenispora]